MLLAPVKRGPLVTAREAHYPESCLMSLFRQIQVTFDIGGQSCNVAAARREIGFQFMRQTLKIHERTPVMLQHFTVSFGKSVIDSVTLAASPFRTCNSLESGAYIDRLSLRLHHIDLKHLG